MIENLKTGHAGVIDKGHRSQWSTPVLTRIKAGEAEAFTRDADDGAFSTS